METTKKIYWENGFFDKQNEQGTRVEISEEMKLELLKANAQGKMITSDQRGYPMITDAPVKSEDTLKQEKLVKDIQRLEGLRKVQENMIGRQKNDDSGKWFSKMIKDVCGEIVKQIEPKTAEEFEICKQYIFEWKYETECKQGTYYLDDNRIYLCEKTHKKNDNQRPASDTRNIHFRMNVNNNEKIWTLVR